MGYKYTIRFMRNGMCAYVFDRTTNNIIKALWYLLTLSIKYPMYCFSWRQIKHIIKLEQFWRTSYGDAERSNIMREIEAETKRGGTQ